MHDNYFDTTFAQFDMKIFRRYFDFQKELLDPSLSVVIHTLGHHIHPVSTPYPDVKHPESHYFSWDEGRSLQEFQLLFICKGRGTFEASGMPPQSLEEGTVVLLYPGVWHRYRPDFQTGWEEYWVGFSGAYAKHLLEQECFSPQKPFVKVTHQAEFLATFQRLFEVVEVREVSYQKLASFVLLQLLGIVYTSVLSSNQQVTRKEKIIDAIRKDVDENWAQSIDYELLASKHNVGYVWFRKAFKEVTGTSPNQYHLLLKLRKAKQLLLETHLTVSEIAFQCGFESVFYFSRIFKSKMKTNPSELRKKN